MVTQAEVARLAGLDLSTVNKILNRRSLHLFRQDTIDKVFECAHQAGYNLDRIKHYHRRRKPRQTVSMQARVFLYRRDGSLYDEGTCTVRDISLCGAFISDLTLGRDSLSLDQARVKLEITTQPLTGTTFHCDFTRFVINGLPCLGLNFRRQSKEVASKLRLLLSQPSRRASATTKRRK